MANDSDTPIRIREGAAAWRLVEDEAILLDLESSRYLGINKSGTILWAMVVDGTDRSSLVARLQSEYDLSEDEASTGVDAFLEACRSRNLLEA